MSTTMLKDLVNPEVMANMISASLPNALKATGFFKVDTTLTGRAGNTITVPQWGYIGEAKDLAEGVQGTVDLMGKTEKDYTIKKAVKNVELTDEAILSGYGDPVGEVTKQLRMAIMDKIDSEGIFALKNLAAGVTDTEAALSYDLVTEAVDIYTDTAEDGEDEAQDLYLLVSKAGISQLRKDQKFIDKNNGEMLGTGVVGMVAGAKVVISRKVDNGTAFLMKPQSLTAFIKRDVNLETSRDVLAKKTLFSADEHYTVAVEDTTKVVKIIHKAAFTK